MYQNRPVPKKEDPNKKQTLRIDVGGEYGFDKGNEKDIEDVINFLISAKEKGATLVHFYASGYDGDGNGDLQPILYREETDEEVKARIEADEKYWRDKNEANYNRAKAEYERLKAIFDK